MEQDQSLREHLLHLLGGGGAHIDFESAVADFPVELINEKADGVPYTPWHLLEHIRIAQWDILEFTRDAAHVSPKWPEDYWPGPEAEADAEAWARTVESIRADLKSMTELVADPSSGLHTRLAHGEGQTLLRETLLVADHNAYHLGALVTLRRVLEARRGGEGSCPAGVEIS